jgi:Ribbon-helix-helix domain
MRIKRKLKIPRYFKLNHNLDVLLRRHSKKTSINQTRIVEIALEKFFAVKN